MRLATFRAPDVPDDRAGVMIDDDIHALPPGSRLVDLVAEGQEHVRDVAETLKRNGDVFQLSSVALRPPIPKPPTIRDFATFEQHVRFGVEKLGRTLPDDYYEIPIFYYCNSNAVSGTDEVVEVPGNTARLDFELGAAAIVGRPGRDIEPSDADQHIAGFCIMNDWSARDLQSREMSVLPIGPSKGKDFANSIGPYLVTPDELEPFRKNRGYDLRMTASVNGVQYGEGSLADMCFSFAELVAYASRCSTLQPGDVLCTGTVGGGSITESEGRLPWLAEGDEVVLEVDVLGVLRNRVTCGREPAPLRRQAPHSGRVYDDGHDASHPRGDARL